MDKIYSKWPKKRDFEVFLKIFPWDLCLYKSHTCDNSGSGVISQNAVCKSNCRVFKSVTSQEKLMIFGIQV